MTMRILGAGLLFVGVSAIGQAQENVVLEQITVTARRSEENLMTVPASVSALTSDDFVNRNIKDQTEIAFFEPSFQFVHQPGGASPFVVRGNGAVTFRGLVEGGGSGSVFIDGAPTTSGLPPTLDQVERVEVLKGPQSAYFGRSTFAGAINYITKTPSLTQFKGEISAEVSSFSSNDSSIGLNFPIIDNTLAVRLTGRHQEKGGQYTNYTAQDQKMGTQGTDSVSATVFYQPTEKLSVKAWTSYIFMEDGPQNETGINATDGFYNMESPPGATYRGGYITGPIPNVSQLDVRNISCVCTVTPYVRQFLLENSRNWTETFDTAWFKGFGAKIHEQQSSLRIDYEVLPGYQLSSLSAYHHRKMMQRFDINNRAGYDVPNPLYGVNPDTLPYQAFNNQTQFRGYDWSQELRFTSPQDRTVSWMFGASYLYQHSPGSSLHSVNATGPTNYSSVTTSDTTTPAVYGAVHYKFLNDFTLSAEARYQWDKLFSQTHVIRDVVQTGAAAVPRESTFTSFSPRVSLDWNFAPGSMAYVLYSRGYKPGGFNTVVTALTSWQREYVISQGGNGSLTFDQERLDNYEIGLKSTFLDNRARVAVSLYYDKWLDGQVPNQISVPVDPTLPAGGTNTARIASPITNAGKIDLYGVEAQADFQITSKLLANLTFAYNGTDVKHYETCSDCLQILGTRTADGSVPNAPKLTGAAGLTYTDDLIGDWEWFGRADYTYRGKMFIDYTNLAWVQPANRVNLTFGVDNGGLRFTAFVRNVTNNSTPPSVTRITNGFFNFFPPNQHSINYSLPEKRSYGVTASYDF